MRVELPDPSLFHVAVDIEVRWGDLDALAHVNNSTYFTYFESARIAWFGRMAPDQPISLQSVGPIVARARCDFLKPIRFPAVVRVATRARKLGTSSLEMDYLVTDRQSGEVHALGEAVLVMFDYRTGLKVPIPDELRRRIQAAEALAPSSSLRPISRAPPPVRLRPTAPRAAAASRRPAHPWSRRGEA